MDGRTGNPKKTVNRNWIWAYGRQKDSKEKTKACGDSVFRILFLYEGDTSDYWLDTVANAVRSLYQLIALAKMRPDCIWSGDWKNGMSLT